MTDPNSVQVPNPVLGWLQSLLSRVQTAQSAIPNIDAPTASIGPGPAWTGSKARDVHDHDLAPHAKPFKDALNALDDEVSAKIAEVRSSEPTVSAGVAKAMRLDYEFR